MDEVLVGKCDALAPPSSGKTEDTGITIDFLDNDAIEISGDKGFETYTLKPMRELYGTGSGESAAADEDAFLPLLLCIEQAIVRYDESHPLTDAAVALVLDHLSMDPATSSDNPLVRRIQCALRLTLSLNDYSRQEVRQAIRKVARSVRRHENGNRGYLEFVREFISPER